MPERPDAAAQLSKRFAEQHKLAAACLLEDGFEFEEGGDTEVRAVVLDRRQDAALERFVERCKKKLRKARDDATQAMVLALLVSDACGRSGVHANDLPRRHARLAGEHASKDTGELLIGNLLGDRVVGGERQGRHYPSGAGLVPHRALLFKALADWLGLFDCTFERQATSSEQETAKGLPRAAWNVAYIAQLPYVVDVALDPGTLYEEHSAKAAEYLRVLAALECYRQPGGPAPPEPPSSRSELPGHVPRPPWHAEPWELDVRRADRIGRGGFGEVFHGCWAGVHVAIKEIKDATPTDADVVDFILEIALLSQLNHPNIVRFWRGSVEVRGGNRSLLMVTEFVKTGGLSRLLHGHGGPPLPEPLTLAQSLSFALDIARGVQYLHSQRVLHLDLKSPNVLCAAPWTAKLCDFGLAKIRGEHTVVQSTLQGVSPVWAPPEMLDERVGGLTEKADVYSFAIIFFELLTKRVPFQEVSQAQLPSLKAAGTLPQIPHEVPEDCTELMRQCCASAPNARPSMSGVVARVRECAAAHGVQLSEVRPPASLLREEGPERRAREAEEAAAQRLAELDCQRVRVRAELDGLQHRIAEVRKKTAAVTKQVGVCQAEPVNDTAWVDAFVQEVAGSRFRCSLCCKLFRGAEFARRHVITKHKSEAGQVADTPEAEAKDTAAPRTTTQPRFSQGLQDAATSGDANAVSSLLSQSANPEQQDDGGTGPLCLASRQGHAEVVRLLLEAAGARAKGLVCQATGAGLTALHVAAGEGHVALLVTLLEAGARVEASCARGKTPLLHAGEGGHAAAVGLLVEARADACCQTQEGETLLHVVSRFGDSALVAQVVAWKANLLAQDKDGWTPLHEAAHWGAAAVAALCSARADVQAHSRDGETPLHVALAGYERVAACEALLNWGADPRAADIDGETPLHVAARRGNSEACKALLLRNAGVQTRNHAGHTPLDLAVDESVKAMLAELA